MALDFPTSPTDGQVYDNWIYNDTKGAWEAKPLTPGVAATSDTPPLAPKDGDVWYNTTDGSAYVYYVDVDGGQWVQIKSDATLSSTLGTTVNALQTASPITVASDAARNALFPSPAQGNSVFRTDKGYTEKYFALYNASTNVGGATPAGWYPVDGTLPVYQVVKNATNFTPTSGSWFLLNNTSHWTAVEADPTGNITYNGNFTVALTGWYEIFGAVWTDGGAGAPGIFIAKKNNVNQGVGDMLAVQSWAGGFNWTTGHISRAVRLNAGDYVHWQYITNNPVAVGPSNREATYLGVRWLRPAKG